MAVDGLPFGTAEIPTGFNLMIEFYSCRNKFLQKRWYFRVRAKNHEILVVSEAYNAPQSRMKGLSALHGMLSPYVGRSLPIRDLDMKED